MQAGEITLAAGTWSVNEEAQEVRSVETPATDAFADSHD